MTTFLETHWRLSVASILLVGVFIWVAVIFYSPPSPADSHSLSTLQKYVAVFKEVAAGHLTVVHVMADGQTDMARFNGAVLEVGEVRQRDIEWKQFQSVVADAGLASLQSQYQSPGDPSLVYEDVFYTLMSRDMYLALQYGVYAANYPLTEEDFEIGKLPEFLQQQKGKLFGLTIAPDRLRQIRKERRPMGKYSSAQQVRYELRESEKIFKKYGISHVDTTEFSIEEISSRILDSTGVDRRVRP